MNKLFFATSNKDKLAEAREILSDIEIESVDFKIDEVQSLDSIEVATKKAKSYFEQIKQPLFVDDNALIFDVLNKLPGPYIGDFSKALGNEGLIKLLENHENRKALVKVAIVYIDENGMDHSFTGESLGQITTEPRGTNGFGWDPIFIPDGYSKTYAEMTTQEKNECSMRRKALDLFKAFILSSKANNSSSD